MKKIMIQKITQNNWNFWTVNLIMWAKKLLTSRQIFRYAVPARRSYCHKKALVTMKYGSGTVQCRQKLVLSVKGSAADWPIQLATGRVDPPVGSGWVRLNLWIYAVVCDFAWTTFFLLIIGLVVLATRWQASDIEVRWAGWVISSRFKSLFSVAAWIVRAAVRMGMRTVMKPHGPVGILRRFSKMDMRLSGNALNTLNVVVAVWNASEMALSFHDQSYTARAVQFVIYFVLLAFFSL